VTSQKKKDASLDVGTATPKRVTSLERKSGAEPPRVDHPGGKGGGETLEPALDSNNPTEQFIPLSRGELFHSLPEIEHCTPQEQAELRELFRVMAAMLHHQYHAQFSEVQRLYQPLDPDSVFEFDSPETDLKKSSDHVFDRLRILLDRANYRRLSQGDLEMAVDNASVLGIKLSVDFSLFEDLYIYARGDREEKWTKRTWWKFFREEKFDVKVFQRLVIAFRLRDHQRLSKDHSTDVVYLKSFKSIPHSDMHALLPGTQVKMTLVDQGKIILPSLSGLAFSIFKLIRLTAVFSIFATIFSFFKYWGLLIGILLYIAKGFFTYFQTRDKYHLNLTRHLYFQNLDNNAGVLLRVLHEAESQDYREMVLAYYILWRFGEDGLAMDEVDRIAEQSLHKKTRLAIDFEVSDALKKLEAMAIVFSSEKKWFCKPVPEALKALDFRWDSVFAYNWPEGQPQKT
jgi:hypothetical protein